MAIYGRYNNTSLPYVMATSGSTNYTFNSANSEIGFDLIHFSNLSMLIISSHTANPTLNFTFPGTLRLAWTYFADYDTYIYAMGNAKSSTLTYYGFEEVTQAWPTSYSAATAVAVLQPVLEEIGFFSGPTQDRTDVSILPSTGGTSEVVTEDNTDTISITPADGYEFNYAELINPRGDLEGTYKATPIVVRRDTQGTYILNVYMVQVVDPYAPGAGIPDLPSDIIDAQHPSDYIGQFINAGFYKIFVPTLTQLTNFVTYLYDQTFIDAIKQLWNRMLNVDDLIVGVMIMPVAPTIAGTKVPRVGWVPMTESQSMDYTSQQYYHINLGSINVNRVWNNYLDFSPYTKVSIYLPFIGERTLETNDIMGKTLNVEYNIDLLSGNCVAYIKVNGSIHYQFSGNCAYVIPISQADTTGMFLQPLKAIAGISLAVAGVATGNPMMTAAGTSMGATVLSDDEGVTSVAPPNLEISSPGVQKIDGLSANSGYMGVIQPYISIERVIPDINSGFAHTNGYQANKYRRIGDLTGYTKVQEVHLDGLSATATEVAKIEALLKGGIII